eukprot:3011631-Amphidinium_carterae.1
MQSIAVHAQQGDEKRTPQVCSTVQQNELEWTRDVATTTCHIRSRRESATTTHAYSDIFIMNPTWNNVTQKPNELIRQFNHWRDEIANYEDVTRTTIELMKTPLRRLWLYAVKPTTDIQGPRRSWIASTTNGQPEQPRFLQGYKDS